MQGSLPHGEPIGTRCACRLLYRSHFGESPTLAHITLRTWAGTGLDTGASAAILNSWAVAKKWTGKWRRVLLAPAKHRRDATMRGAKCGSGRPECKALQPGAG